MSEPSHLPSDLTRGPHDISGSRVLIVDDEPTVTEVLSSFLEHRGMRVFTAASSSDALEVLHSTEVQIVLLDLVLGGEDGLALVKTIRADYSSMPIIIVTGYPSLDAAVAAMRAGATDFVIKPVDGPTLELRIGKALELEFTRRLANTDGLTGLYNHRYFQERLAEEVDRAHRYGKALSLALFDLDRFKRFNDNFGHPRGDEALIEVSRVLRRTSRSSDIIARYGGEEFAALLPESSREESVIFADRARSQIEELQLGLVPRSQKKPLTISVGVASLEEDETGRVLIERADRALYRAKEAGRNRVMVDDPEEAARAPEPESAK